MLVNVLKAITIVCWGVDAAVASSGPFELWAQWGLAGVVIALVMTQSWLREKRMAEALDRHAAENARREENSAGREAALINALASLHAPDQSPHAPHVPPSRRRTDTLGQRGPR